jgi:hypothetical protein
MGVVVTDVLHEDGDPQKLFELHLEKFNGGIFISFRRRQLSFLLL